MPPTELSRAFLLLGSNIDPEENLPAAVCELERCGRVIAVSRVWESAPIGDENQPHFLNAAVLLETKLSAAELRLTAIAEVETKLDRIRDPRNVNAARTIDIDIALFNRDVLSVGNRRVPDPDILTRPFAALPLAELDPDFVHPTDGRTLAEIAAAFEESGLPDGLRLREDVRLNLSELSPHD